MTRRVEVVHDDVVRGLAADEDAVGGKVVRAHGHGVDQTCMGGTLGRRVRGGLGAARECGGGVFRHAAGGRIGCGRGRARRGRYGSRGRGACGIDFGQAEDLAMRLIGRLVGLAFRTSCRSGGRVGGDAGLLVEDERHGIRLMAGIERVGDGRGHVEGVLAVIRLRIARCCRGVLVVIVGEVLAVEGVFAVIERIVDLFLGNARQRRLFPGLGGVGVVLRVCGVLVGAIRRLIGAGAGVGVGGRGRHRLRGMREVACGLVRRRGGRLRGCGRHAVALHFLGAKLLDDGGAHDFGDDVEFAAAQGVVYDEAHERLAVHGQAVGRRSGGKARLAFACERRIEAEEALVVVAVHENRVQGGGVFPSGAEDFLPAHLLFSLFDDLHGGKRGIEDFAARSFRVAGPGEQSHGWLPQAFLRFWFVSSKHIITTHSSRKGGRCKISS